MYRDVTHEAILRQSSRFLPILHVRVMITMQESCGVDQHHTQQIATTSFGPVFREYNATTTPHGEVMPRSLSRLGSLPLRNGACTSGASVGVDVPMINSEPFNDIGKAHIRDTAHVGATGDPNRYVILHDAAETLY